MRGQRDRLLTGAALLVAFANTQVQASVVDAVTLTPALADPRPLAALTLAAYVAAFWVRLALEHLARWTGAPAAPTTTPAESRAGPDNGGVTRRPRPGRT